MITLFTIGILFFAIKMFVLSIKLSWGITKAIFWVFVSPIILMVLALSGIVVLAVPLLILGLAAVVLSPMFRFN